MMQIKRNAGQMAMRHFWQGNEMQAKAVLETVIYADDPLACGRFYAEVLGLIQTKAVPGRFCFLRCGAQMVLIFAPGPAADPAQQGQIPLHGARGPGHLCFGARDAAELQEWLKHLTAKGVVIEHQQDWAQGQSVYFRDPAGNSVEIAMRSIWALD
jgi:catechol 2,3-dioxygenase-like lactoylglutathione lyase family enzyme